MVDINSTEIEELTSLPGMEVKQQKKILINGMGWEDIIPYNRSCWFRALEEKSKKKYFHIFE